MQIALSLHAEYPYIEGPYKDKLLYLVFDYDLLDPDRDVWQHTQQQSESKVEQQLAAWFATALLRCFSVFGKGAVPQFNGEIPDGERQPKLPRHGSLGHLAGAA